MSSQNKAAAVSLAGHLNGRLLYAQVAFLDEREREVVRKSDLNVRFLAKHMSYSPASLSPARRDARTASAESPLPCGATPKSTPGRM